MFYKNKESSKNNKNNEYKISSCKFINYIFIRCLYLVKDLSVGIIKL